MTEKEEKIIMYDSPEAAEYKTITGWVGGNKFWGKDEHMARWSGCTHTKCECGAIIPIRSYSKCDDCRHKQLVEFYNKMPFREYNGEPVFVWSSDEYLFSEEDIIEYCEENELEEVDLLFCEPNHWTPIYCGQWEDIMAEDADLPKELKEALKIINSVIDKLPPASYSEGKIRTTYRLNQ